MNNSNTVLVVGSAGRIGQAVVAELKSRGLHVRGFDRQKTPALDDAMVGDGLCAHPTKNIVATKTTPAVDEARIGGSLADKVTAQSSAKFWIKSPKKAWGAKSSLFPKAK